MDFAKGANLGNVIVVESTYLMFDDGAVNVVN